MIQAHTYSSKTVYFKSFKHVQASVLNFIAFNLANDNDFNSCMAKI